MTASQHFHREPAAWQAVRRAAAAVRHVYREQTVMWQLWWQANRATAPSTGPLRRVLTIDGYRLAGGHLSTSHTAHARDAS